MQSVCMAYTHRPNIIYFSLIGAYIGLLSAKDERLIDSVGYCFIGLYVSSYTDLSLARSSKLRRNRNFW